MPGTRLTTSKKFIIRLRDVIINLMGEEWFSKENVRISSNHPAYRIVKHCEKLIAQDGIFKLPDDISIIPLYMSSAIIIYDISRASGTQIDKFDPDSLIMGNFKSYGDSKAYNRIKDTVPNPNTFESIISELAFSSWCSSKKLDVTSFEEVGFPDFEVVGPDFSLPVLVECKKLMKATNINNKIPTIMKKANKQIKRPNKKCFGILFLDASALITETTEVSDDIPAIIMEIKNLICEATINLNKSISAVILSWDDFSNLGDLSNDRSRTFVYRRRSKLIHHKKPLNIMPQNTIFDDYGISGVSHLEPSSVFDFFDQSRNSLCNCGRNKKFKSCCGSLRPSDRPNTHFNIREFIISKNVFNAGYIETYRTMMENPTSFAKAGKPEAVVSRE